MVFLALSSSRLFPLSACGWDTYPYGGDCKAALDLSNLRTEITRDGEY